MSENDVGYWRRLAGAILNRKGNTDIPGSSIDVEGPLTEAELRSRLAGCAMELREKDRQIEVIRREYAELKAGSDRHASEAGDRALEELFRKLINPLGQLSRFAALHQQGRVVELSDLLTIGSDIEHELIRVGLERVGETGQNVPFDSAAHQRLSGGPPKDSASVTLVSPGYRFKGKILLKASVTTANRE